MAEDLSGLKFGKLTVIKRGENDKSGHVRWWCECNCGNPELILITAGHLKSGHTKSCGCIRKDLSKKYIKDLSGKRFGKLKVIKCLGVKNHRSQWLCKCDCGREIIVSSSSLTSGKVKSCGCLTSVAEYELNVFLTEQNVLFSTQYTFDDCKNKKSLPFDFAVFHPKSKKLMFLIELHGEQHYFPFTFNGESNEIKQKNLDERKYLDSIKSKYCIKNNIPLLIIKYTNFNVKNEIVKTFYSKCLYDGIEFDNYIFTSGNVKNDNQIKIKRVYKRPVVQINLETKSIVRKFRSLAEAKRITGISDGQISDCCKYKCKTAGGYAWAYDNEDLDILDIINFASSPNKKRATIVYQKDKNGNIVKEWGSITEAANYFHIKYQNIQACCSGKQKSCKGFLWEYKI